MWLNGAGHVSSKRHIAARVQTDDRNSESTSEAGQSSSSSGDSKAVGGASSSSDDGEAPSARDLSDAGGEQPSPSGSQNNEGDGDDAKLQAFLKASWKDVKREALQEMTPEQAEIFEDMELDDILDPSRAMRKATEQSLGPVLRAAGIEEDPFDFLIEIVKLGASVQLITCAVVFYGAGFYGHLDLGDSWRAVGGLVLGYLTRPLLNLELVLFPVYNVVAQLLLKDSVYDPPESTPGRRMEVINRVGLVTATLTLVPQLLFGWSTMDALEFVVPVAAGWLFFDISLMLAFIVKFKG